MFKIKEIITGQTDNDRTTNVEKMVSLKYLSNFWRTIAMALINCEINLDLNWSEKCIIMATDITNKGSTFSITVGKLYVSVVTLLTQDDAELFE